MCSLEFFSELLFDSCYIVIFQCDHEHSVCSKAYNFTNLSLKHERLVQYFDSYFSAVSSPFSQVQYFSNISLPANFFSQSDLNQKYFSNIFTTERQCECSRQCKM